MKKFLLIFFSLIIYSFSFSQDAFEGVVKYKTEFKGKNLIMEGMMPDSFIFLFKNKDVRIILYGGIISSMMGDIISKGDSNVSYMLDNSEKIAYRFDPTKYEKSKTVDVEETEKIQKILNKKCILSKVNYSTKDGNVSADIWSTTELPVTIPANNPMSKNFVFSGVEGVPLLIESKASYQSSEYEIIIRAVRIIERPIPAHEFMIPKDYKILPLLSNSEMGY